MTSSPTSTSTFFAFFLKIHDDPLVFSIASCGRGRGAFLETGFSLCVKEAKGRSFYAVVTPYWWIPGIIPELNELVRKAELQYPEAKIVVLCPTQSDTILVRDTGIDALHVHHNAFIDETIFRPCPKTEKRFSAIHNARLAPEKRHHLAWGIPKIAVILTPSPHPLEEQLATLKGYAGLSYCNLSFDRNYQWLASQEVREIICQSHCGIILSEMEGGNFASGEYLLCGVPVISTPSRGGRDEFFDPRCARIVSAERAAIEAAVKEAERIRQDPIEIREITFRKMLEHRLRFIEWLTKVSGKDAFEKASARGWMPSFRDKLRGGAYLQERDRALTLSFGTVIEPSEP